MKDPRLKFSFARLRFDFMCGLESKFPVCCVVEYCIRDFFGQSPAAASGCWYNPECPDEPTGNDYVHCFFHRAFLHKPRSLGHYLGMRYVPGYQIYDPHNEKWIPLEYIVRK
jgi:hypothetical protein